MDNFPEAVRKAVGVRVQLPCARPFTSVQLLQLIEHDHIERYGLFRRKHVLTNIGNNRDNLVNYVEKFGSDSRDELDVGLREELKELVANPECKRFNVNPMNVKQWAAVKAGFNAPIALPDRDLANVGFKAISDQDWSLSFGNVLIEKRSVPVSELERFLAKNNIEWNNVMTYFKGVVTAIYYVTGGLKYTGDSRRVLTSGALLEPTQAPVNINTGWQYDVVTTGQVILSEINPRDYIIAIEYRELK
jgi:hypothetical protein